LWAPNQFSDGYPLLVLSQASLDGLNQRLLAVTSKETQYRHEIKSRELQIEKLKESYKLKLFEKATTKEQIQGSFIRIGGDGNVLPGELKYSSLDF
jgi:hypothetical protein